MYNVSVRVRNDIVGVEEKREIYDQYGEDAINGGFPHGAGGHNPFDIFQNFFGGGDGSRGRRQRRGEDVVYPLKVSLEDLYSGTSSPPSAKVSSRQIRPGRIQQMQYPCNKCNGTGENIKDKDRCNKCEGLEGCAGEKGFEIPAWMDTSKFLICEV
ncbi:hypothetical protein IFM89_015788 [Coptis chinensis]|uniref:CR-type domain-containing protein n=1 Tax=Coptis chinensis TaxID=261450 RepID=A0A835MEM3_9MAGN|nr:hypothetical protein IFM89_015788 [Coptis chinensis]